MLVLFAERSEWNERCVALFSQNMKNHIPYTWTWIILLTVLTNLFRPLFGKKSIMAEITHKNFNMHKNIRKKYISKFLVTFF